MNTATAAQQAGVTVATIRIWCRRGVVDARKVAGRWVIDATSLARRIAIGNRHLTGRHIQITKHQVRPGAMDRRHDGWWKALVSGQRIGFYPSRPEAEMAVARWAPPRKATMTQRKPEQPTPQQTPRGWSKYSRRSTWVHDEMETLTGVASGARDGVCHYCGLPLAPDGECDECR